MKVLLNGTPAGYWSRDDNSPINTDFLRTEVLVDVLNGCKANCKGCFIPRRNVNPYLGNLVDLLSGSSFYVDEVTIGPTDIFDATNFDAVMSDPNLKKIYATSAIAFTSALKQPMWEIKEKLDTIWSLYKGVDRIPDIDFKIVLDIDEYLDKGLDDIKLSLFKEGSVQFRVNYYKGIFNRISYNDLCNKVLEEYNAPVLVLPNFMTNNNHTGKVTNLVESFKRDLLDQNIEHLNWYTMFDSGFNAYGCSNFSFHNGSLYVSPFIFDGIIQRSDYFKVKDINTNRLAENLKVSPCGDCEFLMSCAERNVHMYMHSRGLKECVLPKEYMYANHKE
ncbi:MAG: hypothetical protein NZ811_02745 [Gammaproteobacteria bacterium]|nr:hypothetical protein [Gammaproteobacteria bacterium]